MVFQTYALYPHMTVYKNMAFGLKQIKTPKAEIEKRVKAAAEILQISDYLDRTPRNLSGGQRQRVAIGRAIVRDPEVFLFDEPLSNLDAALRVQTRKEIARLHERLATTMIYVTHDQVEAMTLADKIVVLKDGVIEQVGSPIDLYERPDNAFVAQFIGENNKLRGTVTEIDCDYCVVQTNTGAALYARAVNVNKVGDESTLSLRPERVLIDPEASSVQNLFEARVLELIYLGDHIRTRIELLGRDDFIVKVPNSANHALMREGDIVTVGWLQEDCRALDA